jgi:hypothetical protein
LKPFFDDGSLDSDTQWFKEIVAGAIKELSGVNVSKDDISSQSLDDEGQENIKNLPGQKEAPLQEGIAKIVDDGVSDNTLLKLYKNGKGKTIVEIAKITGLSEYKVKSRLMDMKVYMFK